MMDALPEDLRCKRSDGKQWRCSAPSMPDKTVCEKHYVQAKKRAASSALRATLRRSSPSSPYAAAANAASSSYAAAPRQDDDDDAATDSDADLPPSAVPMAVARPLYGRLVGEPVYVAEPTARNVVHGLPLNNAITAAVSQLVLVLSIFLFLVGLDVDSRLTTVGACWESLGRAASLQHCHREDELPPMPQECGCRMVQQLRQEGVLQRLHLEMVCGGVACTTVLHLTAILD